METKIVDNIIFYPIANFPKYFISKCAKICSEKSNKILKLRTNKYGYFSICLCKDGKRYYKKLHRLLADIFIPNPENKTCVDHKNRIRTDNRLENLRWVTVKENSQNASKKDTSLWQGVCYNKRMNSYRARWNDENSTERCASFSIKLYGMFALLMAINKREEMVKLLYNRSE
tara:strand:- start:59 stop:577 length:519 start_codon:yes stop_codon:yes gene_type:complete